MALAISAAVSFFVTGTLTVVGLIPSCEDCTVNVRVSAAAAPLLPATTTVNVALANGALVGGFNVFACAVNDASAASSVQSL